MDRHELYQEILALPVWDTHTHLTPDTLPAQSFWEIGHYFWFLRELQAAGYPQQPEALPEEARITAYLRAFDATRNTSMHWVVRQILSELYDLELTDAASIRAADQAIRQSAADPGWPRAVVDKLNIQRICIHDRAPREFADLPGVACIVPIDANQPWVEWVERIHAAPDPRATAERAAGEIAQAVDGLARAGVTGVRAPAAPFDRLGQAAYDNSTIPGRGTSSPEIELFLGHTLYRALARHQMVAQLFIGVEVTSGGQSVAVNDTKRITNLHGLFAAYPDCSFELIAGAEGHNLDVVQAARVYPNVYVGGMWWYNFRASTYRQSMQYRLEALPARKCNLVVSDARCIEWCYGKILLIKRLMADLLYDQIEQGWLDADGALRVARDWLHDSAAALYSARYKTTDERRPMNDK
jgi:glucuronate isomerase